MDEFKRDGVEYIHIMGVDNLLAKPIDPIQIGMLRGLDSEFKYGKDVVVKYVESSDPSEKVGRLCTNNKLPSVIEYKDFKTNVPEAQQKDYNKAYIANFAVRTTAVDKFLKYKKDWVVYHAEAGKTVQTYEPPKTEDEVGKLTLKEDILKQSKDGNCVQFEKYAFDAFRLIHPKRYALLEVDRAEEFAPIKNGNESKFDCPETAIRLLSSLHKKWLDDAGYQWENYDAVKDKMGERTEETKGKYDEWVERKKEAEADGLQFTEPEPITNRYLVELDIRTCLDGECIPKPPTEKKDDKEEVTKLKIPFYLECEVNPNKYMFRQRYLTWINQIYRYY